MRHADGLFTSSFFTQCIRVITFFHTKYHKSFGYHHNE